MITSEFFLLTFLSLHSILAPKGIYSFYFLLPPKITLELSIVLFFSQSSRTCPPTALVQLSVQHIIFHGSLTTGLAQRSAAITDFSNLPEGVRRTVVGFYLQLLVKVLEGLQFILKERVFTPYHQLLGEPIYL